jgi:hypothetical protein
MSTAPQEDDRPLLLFCPEQGGWHTGVWFLGKWLAYIDTSVVLLPTHWLPVPSDPPAAETYNIKGRSKAIACPVNPMHVFQGEAPTCFAGVGRSLMDQAVKSIHFSEGLVT